MYVCTYTHLGNVCPRSICIHQSKRLTLGQELDGKRPCAKEVTITCSNIKTKNYSWAKSLTVKRPCAQEAARTYAYIKANDYPWAKSLTGKRACAKEATITCSNIKTQTYSWAKGLTGKRPCAHDVWVCLCVRWWCWWSPLLPPCGVVASEYPCVQK